MNSRRGAITVEAAIVMPVFICVVISLAMLIKLVYIHEVIQHGIDESANELATYSYLYHVSDLQKVDGTLQEKMDEKSQQAEGHFNSFFGAFDSLSEMKSAVEDVMPEIPSDGESDVVSELEEILERGSNLVDNTGRITQEGLQRLKEMQQMMEEVKGNPRKEAESIAWLLAKGLYGDVKSVMLTPVIKQIFKKYIENEHLDDVDLRMKKLNIEGGFRGLDFYSSKVFEGNEDIDIIVKYRVRLPLPIPLLPEISIAQRSTVRAWLDGGDGMGKGLADIWKLPQLERGRKIQQLYGRNLPFNFPVIAIYDEKTKLGTSVKSIDLNSKTYQDIVKLKKQLIQYVDELRECKVLTYKEKDYLLSGKSLILVVPKNSLNDQNRAVLNEILKYAEASGIDISVKEL